MLLTVVYVAYYLLVLRCYHLILNQLCGRNAFRSGALLKYRTRYAKQFK